MIKIRKIIKSEIINLPQLKQFIGKKIVISIEEESTIKNYDKFFSGVGAITIDEKEVKNYRENNLI